MMFLKMMLPLACMAARESPAGLRRARTLAGMSLETREVDILFRTNLWNRDPANVKDAEGVAGFGWHECIGGVPTFIEKWYADKPSYGKLLHDVTQVWAEYIDSESKRYQGNGNVIPRVFEKFSEDGSTAYLLLRRVKKVKMTYFSPVELKVVWDVEEYRKVQGKISRDTVLKSRTIYRQKHLVETDGVLPSTYGHGLGLEPSTFSGQFERVCEPRIGAQDVIIEIYPYINHVEKQNESRLKYQDKSYGGSRRMSLFDDGYTAIKMMRKDMKKRGSHMTQKKIDEFERQWLKREKQDEDTLAQLEKIIIREFKTRAHQAGKENMMQEFMDAIQCSGKYKLRKMVRDLYDLTMKHNGLCDVDFDEFEKRRRTVKNSGTPQETATPWSEWERVYSEIGTNRIEMRNKLKTQQDGNIYLRKAVFCLGQDEYRLKQRFGFPFALRIARRKLTEEQKKAPGIYGVFTTIQEERERKPRESVRVSISKPKPSKPQEEQKMQSCPAPSSSPSGKKEVEVTSQLQQMMAATGLTKEQMMAMLANMK